MLGSDGKPQMPTKRKRHVEKLLNTGKSRIVEKVPFTIQLKYSNTPILQPVLFVEDPGRTNIGAAAGSSDSGILISSGVLLTKLKSHVETGCFIP